MLPWGRRPCTPRLMRSLQSSCWQFVHPKGMPGRCLYTLAIAIALLSCNKCSHAIKHPYSYLRSKCWSDSSIAVNFLVFWWWKSCSINALSPAQQNSAGGGNDWQQAHFKNLSSDPNHVWILQFQTLGWYKRDNESLPFPRLPAPQGRRMDTCPLSTAACYCCNHLSTASVHWLDLESAAVGEGEAGRMCASLRTGVAGDVLPSCTSLVGLG